MKEDQSDIRPAATDDASYQQVVNDTGALLEKYQQTRDLMTSKVEHFKDIVEAAKKYLDSIR